MSRAFGLRTSREQRATPCTRTNELQRAGCRCRNFRTRFGFHRSPRTGSAIFRRSRMLAADNEFPSFRGGAKQPSGWNEKMERASARGANQRRKQQKEKRTIEERNSEVDHTHTRRDTPYTYIRARIHARCTRICAPYYTSAQQSSSERDRGGPSSYCNAERGIHPPLHYRTVCGSNRAASASVFAAAKRSVYS